MNVQRSYKCLSRVKPAIAVGLTLLIWSLPTNGQSQFSGYLFNDSHSRITDFSEFPKIMGSKVGRVALFSIPLQQQWSYRVDGDHAPTYYLNSVTSLNHYSFTKASIAMAYRSLSKENQARFDPMIPGLDPAGMCAADQAKRVVPGGFLFGAENMTPVNQTKYLRVYQPYEPFWAFLTREANEKERRGI